MSSKRPDPGGMFRHRFTVPAEAGDRNGHVNNVVHVQWMQEVAIRHSDATGGTAAMERTGCAWVVRSHKVEYLVPARAGDHVEAVTWVVDFRRVRSLRRYEFVRTSDGKVLARGETEWVAVTVPDGRPTGIPESVRKCFTPLADEGP
jgi:acyl-CoA thioester hydrolase